jgi:hypothetical protein
LSSIALALVVVATERVFDGALGNANNLLKLATLILAGVLAYATTILVAWWLSGRPESAEKMILGFVFARWSRFKPGDVGNISQT